MAQCDAIEKGYSIRAEGSASTHYLDDAGDLLAIEPCDGAASSSVELGVEGLLNPCGHRAHNSRVTAVYTRRHNRWPIAVQPCTHGGQAMADPEVDPIVKTAAQHTARKLLAKRGGRGVCYSTVCSGRNALETRWKRF